jgi:predicted RNase H-like HicB family nuclease
MRELARLVEDLGYSVRVVRTSRPGYTVYEDEYQVIAEPFHGAHRPRTRPVEDASVRKYRKYGRNEAFMKRRTIQVRIFRGVNKYVAECMDLPVVTQGDTLDEVTANIREAIGLHLEDDLAELGIAPDPTIVATMELDAVA